MLDRRTGKEAPRRARQTSRKGLSPGKNIPPDHGWSLSPFEIGDGPKISLGGDTTEGAKSKHGDANGGKQGKERQGGKLSARASTACKHRTGLTGGGESASRCERVNGGRTNRCQWEQTLVFRSREEKVDDQRPPGKGNMAINKEICGSSRGRAIPRGVFSTTWREQTD